jgi:uncharacterized membrane protein YciS (DUF1049 family)
MRYVLYAVTVLAMIWLAAGCQTASVHDTHQGASVDQVGASVETTGPASTETTTSTPMMVAQPVNAPTSTAAGLPRLAPQLIVAPAGYWQPDGTFVPVYATTVAKSTTAPTSKTTAPEFHAKGPDVTRDIQANAGYFGQGAKPGDVASKAPAVQVNDNLPTGNTSTTSAGGSSTASGTADNSTTFAEGKGVGLWAAIGNFFSAIWAWFWWILIGFAVANIVLFILTLIPVTSPVATAILKAEGTILPWIGTVVMWLKAKLATVTLGKVVTTLDQQAAAGNVAAPVFTALSGKLSGSADVPNTTTEKGLIDSLRAPDAPNMVTAGAIAPTAPAAIQPTVTPPATGA